MTEAAVFLSGGTEPGLQALRCTFFGIIFGEFARPFLYMNVKLSLNISPCPNDTFMFDAMINGRIDCEGYQFDVRFFDIEELNARAVAGVPDLCKISYAALPSVVERYYLLDSGSALGRGNGPLLVARKGCGRSCDFDMRTIRSVAIPGEHTTANLLIHRLFPELVDRRPMLFSEIAGAVESGEVDSGVLIHEGRFTYRERGLELVADLGLEWERTTGGLPLPLGAIVASGSLSERVVCDVERLIRRSVEFAMAHPDASRDFVREHAQEMDNSVIDRHISLFVNENSLTLGSDARMAIKELTGCAPDRARVHAPQRPNFPR